MHIAPMHHHSWNYCWLCSYWGLVCKSSLLQSGPAIMVSLPLPGAKYLLESNSFVQCRHVPWILYWIKHALEKRANVISLLFSSTTKWWDSSQSQRAGQCLSSVWLTVIMHSVRQLLRLNHEVGLSDEVPWVQLQVLWPVFDDIHRLNYLKNLCYSIIIFEKSLTDSVIVIDNEVAI